ncbi:DUF6065 family protein [Singulisphaera sp. Ch08]|uniref:DUF6065 family protein n=1 Tax=Singulisphaera sp. Ch08 TaxID=3120278 RepID=A0AAU7CB18_9BACT
MNHDRKSFYAYEMSDISRMPIKTAPVGRDWMDASERRYAYRCLPLTIANQAGWVIACPATFVVTWDGRNTREGLRIDFEPSTEPRDSRVLSHFGSGILTIAIPYLFRTPEGINLWTKGPCNQFKDGAHPLEGIIETDWLPATFTMNWKLTRPDLPVRFERGEAICMVVPVARGLAESLEPRQLPVQANPELHQQVFDWARSRADFNAALNVPDSEEARRGWQKEYTLGVMATGVRATEHQTSLRLKEFV